MTEKYRYLVLASLPFLVLCVFLLGTTSNLPDSNQWDLVPLLEKWYSGSLTPGDLLRQNGEHRIFFPWMILLYVAVATHWNLYYEVAVNLALGIGVCAILFYQVRKMEIFFKARYDTVYFLVAVFVFSVAQSNNWFCGQVAPFLSIISFAAGVLFLTAPEFGFKSFFSAAAAGTVATYTFGNGMLFWVIGFLVLCARPLNRKKTVLLSWAALFGLILATYFWGYQKPAQHPALLFAAQHPLQAAEYFFVFLGAALLPFERFTAIIGFFGLFCFTASIFTAYHAYREMRRDPEALLIVLPWFALAVFCLASAALVTVARSGFGLGQATASRYVTTSNLLWIFLIVLTPVAARSFMREPAALISKLARSKALQYVCLAAFFALQLAVTRQKWVWEKVRKDDLASIGNALRGEDYDEELICARIYATGRIRERVTFLKKHRLALFRGAEPPAPQQPVK